MKDCLIGVDAGGTMTKAAAFDLSGRGLACARHSNEMTFPKPGWTERDADRMWAAAAAAIREVLSASGRSPADIAAISAAGYGSGLYLLDKDGAIVRPGIVSTDNRGMAIVDEWNRSGLAAQVEQRIQQRIWPAQTLVLLAWIQRFEPEAMERTDRVLFCKDFIRYRLCNDLSTDPTDAGIGGLIDVTTQKYALDVLQMLGLEGWLPKLPEIGPADQIVGYVSSKAAGETGLMEGTPVVRGVVDVTAAALSSGVVDTRQLSVVAGTFSINSTLHASPRLSVTPFLQVPYPLGGFLATEGAATSASNLEWMVKTIIRQSSQGLNGSQSDIYEAINAAVGRRIGSPRDALFFPYLFGGPNGAPAGLLGMTADYTFDDIMLTVFEGITFAHKADIDRLLSGHDAARPEIMILTGGASSSHVWSDLFADILNIPVEVPDGSELGALGVSICAASAIGAYPSIKDAVTGMTRRSRRHEPNGERAFPHRAKYPRYSALSKALPAAWNLGAVPEIAQCAN